MIEFTLPIKTVNESNGSHGHWSPKSKRRKIQRTIAFVHACQYRPLALPSIITLIRRSAGTLDDDNLRVSLKSIRDGIADAYGLPDNDPGFDWRYAQEKAKRGVYGVRVRIEARQP